MSNQSKPKRGDRIIVTKGQNSSIYPDVWFYRTGDIGVLTQELDRGFQADFRGNEEVLHDGLWFIHLDDFDVIPDITVTTVTKENLH